MQVSVDHAQLVDVPEGASCAEALKAGLSGKRFKAALACRISGGACDGRMLDLSAPLPGDATACAAVTAETPEGLALLRHSTAHVLAAAVKRLFPSAKVTIGPSIDTGFYYDFDVERPFTPEDFPAIEAEMRTIIAADEPFVRSEMPPLEAILKFEAMHEPYKVELINSLPDAPVSLYQCADFLDLCRGPHVPSTGALGAFTLLSVAGAYWRGNEKNRMLSRIYGTAFADDKALKAYLHQLEEAKRRDHRKLGRELKLFAFHEDVAPGMVFWQPKGMMVRTILEDFLRKEHLKRGYELVQGPQILRKELWEKSGHYANYRENMYFTEIFDDVRNTVDVHGVKPMNCVGHMLLYGEELRSYRDMPQRYFELGVVHRHERSGALHGLLRVRQFTQDDAHILCAPEQLADEIVGVMKLSDDLMKLFGFDYRIFISTRPEKSIGSDEDWERATNALIQAVESRKLPYQLNEGDGAFYGPKIDIKVTDAIGREWQLSTIQVDFTLPERFELTYVGADNERHRPVMVHRAILGSLERFIGVLTEHYAGAFPTWLAPVQARLLTVTDAQDAFAGQAKAFLAERGFRVEADLRNEKLGFKVRAAQVEKIPYILVVGDKEVEAGGVNVRLRSGENLGVRSLADVAELMREDCEAPFKRGGMRYFFV